MEASLGQRLWDRAPRVVTAAVGLGMVSLGIEAAIAHFAGTADPAAVQWAPVLFAIPAGLVLLCGLSLRFADRPFRAACRFIGVGAILLGAAGEFFHLRALGRELDGESLFRWSTAEGALSVAPPPLAPATFIAIGVALMMLASPELVLTRRTRPAH